MDIIKIKTHIQNAKDNLILISNELTGKHLFNIHSVIGMLNNVLDMLQVNTLERVINNLDFYEEHRFFLDTWKNIFSNDLKDLIEHYTCNFKMISDSMFEIQFNKLLTENEFDYIEELDDKQHLFLLDYGSMNGMSFVNFMKQ